VIRFRHLPITCTWIWIARPGLDDEDDVVDVWSVLNITATPRNREMKHEKRTKTKRKKLKQRRGKKESKATWKKAKMKEKKKRKEEERGGGGETAATIKQRLLVGQPRGERNRNGELAEGRRRK
jgi:hypothetical protein